MSIARIRTTRFLWLPHRGRGAQDTIVVRVLRALARMSRFGTWGASILSGIAAPVRQGLTIGSAPALHDGQDLTCVPAYYRQLLDSVDLPDRPPLAAVERELPGEASAIKIVARIAGATVIGEYCNVRKDHSDGKAQRDQHAKPHGCVCARLTVHDNLPPEMDLGIFQRGRSYDAIVRFSNAFGASRSDRKFDGRGMAVKLLDIGAPNILSELVPNYPRAEQHFLLTNYPVFFCRNFDDYAKFIQILDLPNQTLHDKIRRVVRLLFFFLPRRLPQAWIFARTAAKLIRSPLRQTYHSMTPYSYGDDKVVRYIVSPTHTPRDPRSSISLMRGDNFLRDTLEAELDPAQHGEADKAVFDFAVQVRSAATPSDVEDASRRWKRRRDKTFSLAKLEIPLQRFSAPNEVCACETQAFNPWSCIPQHRPLGSLNRMRLGVYLTSMHVRNLLNNVPFR